MQPSVVMTSRAGVEGEPPRDGIDAREQFVDAEGLGDVVVGARAQPPHLVGLVAARGEHEDTECGVLLAKPAADFEAVHAREHEVEQDQVELLLESCLHRGFTVADGVDLVARVRKQVDQSLAQAGFVFDHENAHRRAPSMWGTSTAASLVLAWGFVVMDG